MLIEEIGETAEEDAFGLQVVAQAGGGAGSIEMMNGAGELGTVLKEGFEGVAGVGLSRIGGREFSGLEGPDVDALPFFGVEFLTVLLFEDFEGGTAGVPDPIGFFAGGEKLFERGSIELGRDGNFLFCDSRHVTTILSLAAGVY